MKALLDTHTFLWWITDNPQLSPRARDLIADSANDVYLSAVSGWEIAIKAQLGKLRLPENVLQTIPQFVMTQLALNAIRVLPLQIHHALHVYTLPLHHRDPFDRLLIAQSQLENLPLVTADTILNAYDVSIIW